MATQIKRTTRAEFERFIYLPENADKSFEFVGGEINEKMVSNSYSSKIAARMLSVPASIPNTYRDIAFLLLYRSLR